MPRRDNVFVKIAGIKKITYCKSCGRRMEIKNFNQMLCERCGYRESNTAKAA